MDSETHTALIDAIPDPVLLLDGDRRVVVVNAAARDLLGPRIEDQDLSHVLRHPDVLEAASTALAGKPAPTISITFPVPVRRDFEVHIAALARDEKTTDVILVMRDVTVLRGAEQMRADFVANVSHELRSPLSSLVGFIETLQGTARDDEAARERFLGIMKQEAQRMTRLIDDLLSLSKVEANEHIPPADAIDMTALLQRVAGTLSARAEKKRMTIELDAGDALPPVAGEADQLTEVFHNLVDNAIKYGREGTPIRITAEVANRIPDVGGVGVVVAVRDRGEGIAVEHLPRLTERFYRVDKGRSRSMGGTGLGLAIVKHIVNRHRGRLVIDSAAGTGSAFTVCLPVAAGDIA